VAQRPTILFQRRLGSFPDVRRSAVQPRLPATFEREAELGGNHHLVANRAERFANDLFVRERPVRFGRVEERDAAIDRGADDADALTRATARTSRGTPALPAGRRPTDR